MAREAKTIDVNHINVAGAHGVAFIENVGALVGERGPDARDDLVIGDGAPLDAASHSSLHRKIVDHWIGNGRAASGLIAIPAGAGLLAIAAHVEEPVRDYRLRTLSALFSDGSQILADARADIDASDVLHGERAHGHAKIHERAID